MVEPVWVMRDMVVFGFYWGGRDAGGGSCEEGERGIGSGGCRAGYRRRLKRVRHMDVVRDVVRRLGLRSLAEKILRWGIFGG